jgi:hypothetical protein
MAGKDKTREGTPGMHPESARLEEPRKEQGFDDIESVPLATARNIPRPPTSLAFPSQGKLGKVVISLLADTTSLTSLEEVEKVNKATGTQARTPLMTLILALVAKAGGNMPLDALCGQIPKYWNRPLPTTPYTFDEFIYIMVRNSNWLRVG